MSAEHIFSEQGNLMDPKFMQLAIGMSPICPAQLLRHFFHLQMKKRVWFIPHRCSKGSA
jgi:hypothetical protein